MQIVNDTVKARFPIHKGLLELILFEIKRGYGGKDRDILKHYIYLYFSGILRSTEGW